MKKILSAGSILVLALGILAFNMPATLATDTGVKYPGTVNTHSEGSYNDEDWHDKNNVKADDGNNASITDNDFDNGDYSHVLRTTNFGFSVPAGSTIDGIKVESERYSNAGSARDALVQLTKNGTARVGNSKADTTNNWSASAGVATYGGETDLWGTTWTRAEINDSDFGVHFAARAYSNDTDIYVDFIRITVYYTPDTTPPIITINNPTTSPAQSKTITASTNEGTLTKSITTGSVCDATLTFTAYSSITFSSEADNGKKVCYKAVDAASNTTYSMSNTIAGIDRTGPTVTINQADGQADPTSASPINFTVIFSESVGTSFVTGDVKITGTAGGTKTATVTGSGDTYNVAVTGMTSNGTVIASIDASKAQDLAGNNNSASTSTDNSVTYTLPTYTINASAGTGGTISPSGAVTVIQGANQTFKIEPNSGYIVSDVLVDSVSQGRKNSYPFTNVTADHTIVASFDGGWSAPSDYANNDGVSHPERAYSSNDQYAAFDHSDEQVDYYIFGLDIPPDATINGIVVPIEAHRDSDSTRTYNVSLSWNGGTSTTTSKNATGWTTADKTVIVGGSSDNWGRTWSASDFSDDNFQVRVQSTSGGHTLYLDQLQVKVYYTVVVCGDGLVTNPEACDDGNIIDEDGCSATCTLESGWNCTGEPSACTTICGDGIIAGLEQCESPFDACCDSSTCQFKSSDNVCRASQGQCDIAETCTGSSATCPADAKSTAQCRAAAGDCDIAEVCDGVNNDCPTDVFRPDTYVCRNSLGVCDLEEKCSGSSASCPSDTKSIAECRASTGDCDVAESCDGINNDCPTDVFRPNDYECRASAGICDLNEYCTGSNANCPDDAKSTAQCRAAAGDCDIAEVCDGVNNDCPADVFQPVETPCDDGFYCNGNETCDANGNCQAGADVDCSENDITGIATCDYDPDNYYPTYDYFAGFTSQCDEDTDSCTSYPGNFPGDVTHTCNVDQCSAECDATHPCSDTDCNESDGCVGNDYYDYDNVANTCQEDCNCTTNECGEPTISYNDPACTECQTDDDCNSLDDDDYCDGTVIKHDEGVCIEYTCVKNTTVVQDCNDDSACNGVESCSLGQCVQGIPVDCSGNDISAVGECTYIPDDNPFTWDYRQAFTSVCEEPTGTCTSGDETIAHTCDVQCDGCVCGENCDDDNPYSTDTCNSDTCQCEHVAIPYCGDGIKNGEEECDGTDGVGSHQSCSNECTLIDLTYCGDGIKNGEEECDGTEGVSEHYTCTAQCTLEYVSYCGDGEVNGNEQCEINDDCGTGMVCNDCICEIVPPQTECTPEDTTTCSTGLLGICLAGTQTCDTNGFWGNCIQNNQPTTENCTNQLDDDCDGTVDSADSDCQIPPTPYCGDGIKNNDEQCDGTDGVPEHYSCTAQCILYYEKLGVKFASLNGDFASTTSLLVLASSTIDVQVEGGTSTVSLPEGMIITREDGNNLDVESLTAETATSGSLTGLGTGVVVAGALKWGLENLGLQFNPAITVSIFVGTALNGQTLNVLRSVSGTADWTSDGIVPPATCVVTDGLCTFQATKASYYAATYTPPSPAPSPAPTPPPVGGGSVVLPLGLTIPPESVRILEIGETSVTVTWTTSQFSTSQVIYAKEGEAHTLDLTKPNYGYTNSKEGDDSGLEKVTVHSVTVTDLLPNTTYYYRVVSQGSLVVSQESSFVTLGIAVEEQVGGEIPSPVSSPIPSPTPSPIPSPIPSPTLSPIPSPGPSLSPVSTIEEELAVGVPTETEEKIEELLLTEGTIKESEEKVTPKEEFTLAAFLAEREKLPTTKLSMLASLVMAGQEISRSTLLSIVVVVLLVVLCVLIGRAVFPIIRKIRRKKA